MIEQQFSELFLHAQVADDDLKLVGGPPVRMFEMNLGSGQAFKICNIGRSNANWTGCLVHARNHGLGLDCSAAAKEKFSQLLNIQGNIQVCIKSTGEGVAAPANWAPGFSLEFFT